MNLVQLSHAAMPWVGLAGVAGGVIITGILPLFVDSARMEQENHDYVKKMVANERMIPDRLLTSRGRNLSRVRYVCFGVGLVVLLGIILRA